MSYEQRLSKTNMNIKESNTYIQYTVTLCIAGPSPWHDYGSMIGKGSKATLSPPFEFFLRDDNIRAESSMAFHFIPFCNRPYRHTSDNFKFPYGHMVPKKYFK